MKTENDEAIRPSVLTGATYKVSVDTAKEKITLYITINEHDGKPFELFVNSKNAEFVEHMNLLTIFASHMLRDGISLTKIAHYLSEIHSPFTGHLIKGGYCNSIYARIGKVLSDHVKL